MNDSCAVESIRKRYEIKQRGRAFCRKGRHKALHLDMFGQEDNIRGVVKSIM